MKKNQESDVGKASGVVWKMWLTMKLLFCFLLIGFSTVYGNAFSQVKISISVNEVSLQEVFEKLTEQTGYHFVYSNEMLQRTGKVSVDMQDCDLGQIMAVCLKNTGLWYRLEDNIIVISPKFRQPDVPQKKITLTGNVKDKEGRPLPGVTILLKGSAVGVVSDVDGNFTLTVPEESGLTLVFSFVGMKTQEVVLSGQQVLHIVMLEDVSQMEEVIVTGYQEVKKEKMTGAVTTHIDCIVHQDAHGYYLVVAGLAETRTIEAVRFFLALYRAGVPVCIRNAEELKARLTGAESIGIVPEGVFPAYCHDRFPGESIVDFMNLPRERQDELAKYCRWQPIPVPRMKKEGETP